MRAARLWGQPGMENSRPSDRQIAWGIALALFGLIMLWWNGTFHSSDGLSMYAVADSLARYGRLDTEQIRWLGLQHGILAPDGLLYSNKSLGTSILALPLTWAGLILPGLGPVHTSLVLMPLVTAASGALLYLASRRAFPTLPRVTAVLAALAWGLASPAWPYSKTFFSEPLVALAAIGAMERLLAFRDAEARGRRELVAALGLGFWLGLGVFARLPHIIVLPVFGLAFLVVIWRRYGRMVTHWPIRSLLAFAGPIGIALGLTLWYNWFRAGDPLTTGYPIIEGFRGVWWQGIVGLLISPGRGILWYVPWLVLLVLAIPLAWRLAPMTTATAGATFLVYLLLYGKWLVWFGGYCWGPRFVVPAVPLLGLLVVPAAARWPRLFVGLALLAVAVNLIGVAGDFDQHQESLIQAGLSLSDLRSFFDLQYAQIPGMLRLGRSQPLDVMWITEGRLHTGLATLALALAAIGVASGVMVAQGRAVRLPNVMGGEVISGHWWIVLLLAATTYAFLWLAGAAQPAGYRRVAEAVAAHSPPGTVIWHNDHPNISTFLNLYRGRAAVLGVYEPDDTLSAESVGRLSTLAALPQPVWVIGKGSVGTADALERSASRHRGVVDEISVATSISWPAPPPEAEVLKAMFYFDTPDWHVQPLDVKMGPGGQPSIRLVEAGLSPQTSPGGVIAIRLVWEALAPVSELYQVFVQLIGPEGTPLALQLDPAQNGLPPTSAWQPGQAVTDVHAFSLRADAPPGSYQFVVALQRLSDMTRLETADGRDEVMVGPISVAP
jgi:hypothetical protein